MKLKLIEAGGFSGLRKTSEEDLATLPAGLQEHVEKVFMKSAVSPARIRPQSVPARDKTNYYIEYNGKPLPVDALLPDKELEALIEKLKSKLVVEARGNV